MKKPAPESIPLPKMPDPVESERRLEELLQRINQLNSGQANPSAVPSRKPAAPPKRDAAPATPTTEFVPRAPANFNEARIAEPLVEELVYKFLLARGEATIRQIAAQIRMPFHLCEQIVKRMKNEQMLGYSSQAALNDYVCRLTDQGRDRAKRFTEICQYFGATPVALSDYIAAVKAQTITQQHPSEADLRRAFHDLLVNPALFRKLGPAVNSGRGMFLYGYPGNGKTSIAERITAAFGKYIWIPRAIMVERDIIRIYDPINHEAAPAEKTDGLLANDEIDQRWIKVKRPTVVVGGELRLSHLEIQYNEESGTSEAPVQLKSNCGVLVIDDFGRQQVTVCELLNRWIVPLEKRYDYLNTTSGKKIQVPFDQLVIFSTNLEPKDLVDDAFLRRIPYKIEVPNPTREEFTQLFEIMCGVFQCDFDRELVDYLIETHYIPNNRAFRNCHPRDILLQVKNLANFKKQPFVLTRESIDFAVENYFSIM